MGYIEVQHIQAMSTTTGTTVFALFPVLLNVSLLAAGYVLWKSRFDGRETLQVAGWVFVGALTIGLLATWTITHQNIRGRPFAHASFVTVNNMSVGGMIGFLVGWYRVSSDRHRRALEDERLKLDFLNQLLRHNVLNGIQIITGRVELLSKDVDESEQAHLRTIQNRSDEIVRFINAVHVMNQSSFDHADRPLQPRNLTTVLESEVDSARRDFEQAAFSIDVPDDVVVVADDLLPELFTNLLVNAVQHNDQSSPHVTISATDTEESVVIRIADNGPGIPDGEKAQMVDWNEKGAESAGTGLGLAIADTLTQRYDGRLWLEDNEPRGTVVTVELPSANGTDRERLTASEA